MKILKYKHGGFRYVNLFINKKDLPEYFTNVEEDGIRIFNSSKFFIDFFSSFSELNIMIENTHVGYPKNYYFDNEEGKKLLLNYKDLDLEECVEIYYAEDEKEELSDFFKTFEEELRYIQLQHNIKIFFDEQ